MSVTGNIPQLLHARKVKQYKTCNKTWNNIWDDYFIMLTQCLSTPAQTTHRYTSINLHPANLGSHSPISPVPANIRVIFCSQHLELARYQRLSWAGYISYISWYQIMSIQTFLLGETKVNCTGNSTFWPLYNNCGVWETWGLYVLPMSNECWEES